MKHACHFIVVTLSLGGCNHSSQPPASATATISSTVALTSDDSALWVVNPDSDSVSIIDVATRTLTLELPLGTAPPAQDPTTHRFEPAVAPRALAILAGDKKVYVAGQTANRVYVVDATTRAVTTSIPVAAAPVSVVAAPDGSALYVVSHEAALITKIDPVKDIAIATLAVAEHPWGASVSADGKRLYVSHLLLGAGVTTIDTASFTVTTNLPFVDQPAASATVGPVTKLVPNGQVRGAYMAVPHPTASEIWVPHMLLATGTSEPLLDFQSTVFPTVTIAAADGSAENRRLLFKPGMVPGATGSFSDSVSGPRAIAFTPDGKLALLVLGQSEDVMVFDGSTGDEKGLVRPVPSTFLEGIVVDHAGKHAYVSGRNSHDITVLSIDQTNVTAPVAVDGATINCLVSDPMPSQMRLGQRLFFTANTGTFPITKNFWVACASCHLEGGTDAVTWRFLQGPRDTPSNAGGPINTGFLLRQATRNDVIDYDKTIQLEQGGSYDRNDPADKIVLEELSAFVNYAIPFPQNPNLSSDGMLTDAEKRGQATFTNLCSSCHTGAYLTDSGTGNPTLDFAGTILLHDVGTCVTNGPFNDMPSPVLDVVDGPTHAACDFDTPTLRGIFATAPYFHDGSAKTLADVVDRLPFSAPLAPTDKSDLVDFLLTL